MCKFLLYTREQWHTWRICLRLDYLYYLGLDASMKKRAREKGTINFIAAVDAKKAKDALILKCKLGKPRTSKLKSES